MIASPDPPESPAVTIRPARLADAAAIANLAAQLGYPSTAEQIAQRMSTTLDDPRHCVLAAVGKENVVGWAHAFLCRLLESDAYVELGGLVVEECHRGEGVGGQLLAGVEAWARQIGCKTVYVRSNVIREEAHYFYADRGYERFKSQHVFRKRL